MQSSARANQEAALGGGGAGTAATTVVVTVVLAPKIGRSQPVLGLVRLPHGK